MRVPCALVVLIVGCGELNLEGRKSGGVPEVVQVEQSETTPTTPSPPVTQPVDPATQAGNGTPETTPADPTTQPDDTPADTIVPEPDPPRKSIIGQTTDQVVDFHEFTQKHPQMQIVENKFSGSDPLSQAVGGYYIGARASSLGMQSAIKTHTAVNGKPPTYAEFMKMMKDHRVSFAQLPGRRIYAYDSQKGTIVVLEEPVE